jgi:hypothetical protein
LIILVKNSSGPRLILICCGLLAFASGQTFAAGEYQKGRDGKATIWNWQPKQGETVDWSGGRDKDGYANGFGDLTWYNADGKTFGLFYGKMEHGKFEGAVNMHTGGRISHAYFVGGDRVTSWARGAAKSNMTESEAAVVGEKKVAAEKAAAEKEKIAKAEPIATPTPTPKKEQTAKIAKTEAAPPAEKTARQPDSHPKRTAEKSPSANVAEKKSEPLSYDEELKRTEPATKKKFTEPTPLPKAETEKPSTESLPLPTSQPSEPERAIEEPSLPAIQETPPVLHEPTTEQTAVVAEKKPETADSSEETRKSSSPPAAKESPADISVNSLADPPSSLRAIPESSSSEKSQAEPESAQKSDGPLTETDVIKLADTEARVQGAPLDNYERPNVDHSQVKGKWTLFYAPKKDESGSGMPSFSVTIEDKTRKIDLRK